jgi:hypothetical protein
MTFNTLGASKSCPLGVLQVHKRDKGRTYSSLRKLYSRLASTKCEIICHEVQPTRKIVMLRYSFPSVAQGLDSRYELNFIAKETLNKPSHRRKPVSSALTFLNSGLRRNDVLTRVQRLPIQQMHNRSRKQLLRLCDILRG